MAEQGIEQIQVPAAEQAPTGTMRALGRNLTSVLDAGREILARRRNAQAAAAQPSSPIAEAQTAGELATLCHDLLEHRGEASGIALASEIVAAYQALPQGRRMEFFSILANDFEVDRDAIISAVDRYRADSKLEHLWSLKGAVEAPRQKLFRRLNTAPGGTKALVAMRGDLLKALRKHPHFRGIDSDLKHLFISWFNKGFLELRKIDWDSPASVLEKLIDYEAVHEINGWDDMRCRLQEDRRCFAFFHPALDDDPLVFVEIALTQNIPDAIAPLMLQDREVSENEPVNTVVFYSISNCHPGLASISFGNFLIKSVVQELRKEIPTLDTFVTLSPVPGFRKWLLGADLQGLVADTLIDRVREPVERVVELEIFDALQKLCAHYLINTKSGDLPLDPVARFHLGNGAQLHQVNGAADLSAKGLEQSGGIMVNYLYDLPTIEENHDAYFDQGKIAVSKAVRKLAD